jgi:hypothetical protein
MHLRLSRVVSAAAGLAALAFGGPVLAAVCTGVSVGAADTSDVTFAAAASDSCVVSTENAQAGPNGNPSAFSGTFGSGWSLLGKVTGTSGNSSLNGVDFTWGFTQTTNKLGTWSLTTSQSATFDLVFAMHAGGRTGSFLFDDQTMIGNQLTSGTWAIEWLNNGGQVPDFSNLTLFARDVVTTPVPEPETYAMMLAGLGMMGYMARRRRKSA